MKTPPPENGFVTVTGAEIAVKRSDNNRYFLMSLDDETFVFTRKDVQQLIELLSKTLEK